jgi:hypothetical protein
MLNLDLRTKHLLRAAALLIVCSQTFAQLLPTVPFDQRGRSDAERRGIHDANNIRTEFWNYGMVGNYPADPLNVDLSTFHSVEVPKGSGVNYSDGITPFVLTRITQRNGVQAYVMETGFRERQGNSPKFNRVMRFEPRPGYFQADPAINQGRSPAVSNDPRTWPLTWPDKDDTWDGFWDGYFGKRPAADQESYTVMDDQYYDAWNYFPDNRDTTRYGLGLSVSVRGFQWANPQAGNVIFWHYDVANESTTDYPVNGSPENIIFGLYMDSGVGGSAIGCDPVPESDDDNAYFDRSSGLNLVYTWDNYGHGRGLTNICSPTGYLGYAYLETPGKPFDGIDNDNDGITDERRDSGPGTLIVGQQAIREYATAHYNMTNFQNFYGPLENRPAYRAGRWWTGDENMDWTADVCDVGADGVAFTNDKGEGDGIPTAGEPNFDQTDLNESDQIGLTGFKMSRINSVQGLPTDNVVFFTDANRWPERLYTMFTSPVPSSRFDSAVVANYNIAFLFASGPFTLKAAQRERFSLALAYGSDLEDLRNTVKVVQAIYNANYQFATPPPTPTVMAETGNGYVQLSWDDVAEHSIDQITRTNDFEGYRIYRSTDPDFLDVKVISNGRGTGTIGNGKPIAQFDLQDGISGFSSQVVDGVSFYLGTETGITHTWRDTTVTNGQEYYYGVTSYDYGATFIQGNNQEAFTFYPSENSMSVSRTLRGGTILPKNVVAVRPNPKVLGYVPAAASASTHLSGAGVGTVDVRVKNSALVPDHHIFKIVFKAPDDSVHASTYSLIDSTTGATIFQTGSDFLGAGTGITGSGLQPVATTLPTIQVDTSTSKFAPGSTTNALLDVKYRSEAFPINYRRTGFPDNFTITFSNTILDTSQAQFPVDPMPVKFKIVAHTPAGDRKLPFVFFDTNDDSTLSFSSNAEEIQILTGPDTLLPFQRVTWSIRLRSPNAATRPPGQGDVYNVNIQKPFGAGDVFVFTSNGESVPNAATTASNEPYVVPNPYVGAASFEPAPFGVQGRGDRRIEFRNLPRFCTIRIFTVRGELVQTLYQDGALTGMVPWDLRTKDNLDVAPGLYLYTVDGGSIGRHTGKFAIIK